MGIFAVSKPANYSEGTASCGTMQSVYAHYHQAFPSCSNTTDLLEASCQHLDQR